MYIATTALCACGGCHNSLLSIGEPLVAFLSGHTISFSSMLVDRRSISPSDVVIVTGGIGTAEELEIAREVSRTSRKVIAVGSCAVYGGIPGLRDKGLGSPAPEGGQLPPLLDSVKPLDSVIPVELYVPGCPPLPNLVFESLKSLVEGYSHIHFEDTVCSECPRSLEASMVESWHQHPGCGVPVDACLLEEGFLCLGPVTRGGCLAPCPSRGAICIGCRGPSDMVLSSQLHSLYTDMVKFVSLVTGERDSKTEKKIAGLLGSLYTFTRRDPVTLARAKERIDE